MRLIATEEAFATEEYFHEYLKLAERVDSPTSRYLKMYYRGPLVRQLSDLDYRLKDMDEHGVNLQVLSFTAPGVQAFDAGLGSEMAARANDYLAAAVRAHPKRFAGLGAIAPQSPERAAREIDRIMQDLKLNGIIINSHTQGEFLDDEKFSPILAAAVANDAPIYLHPNFPADAMIQPYARYGMMGALWGFAAECSLHVVRMILAGVFDQFPTLKIVLGHLGEGLPFWLDRLDNRYANILRRGGLEPLGMKRLQRLPSEYFRSNFWVSTSGMNTHPPLEFVLSRLGAERVLFAVDYPYEQSAEATAFIRSAPLTADVLKKIAHENAERLFRIPS
jgi:5-carboxyvanillate decarboxylase